MFLFLGQHTMQLIVVEMLVLEMRLGNLYRCVSPSRNTKSSLSAHPLFEHYILRHRASRGMDVCSDATMIVEDTLQYRLARILSQVQATASNS